MRLLLVAAIVTGSAIAASAGEPDKAGAVVGGSFGMGGSDYYGDVHDRMPFTQEAPPRPLGIVEMDRFRAVRRRAELATARASAPRGAPSLTSRLMPGTR
jgi:hypothetical protein